MKITKGEGVLFSLAIMMPYVFMYGAWVINSQHSLKLIGFFFLGIFLHFLRKIEPGTKAELVFFGKATGTFWSDGFCLTPSLLPILHNIGIYLLWDLKKPTEYTASYAKAAPNIHHFKDQRLPEYVVNTQTSFLAMQSARMFGNLFGWFFKIDNENPELMYQKIGFRIILLALLFGSFADHSPLTYGRRVQQSESYNSPPLYQNQTGESNPPPNNEESPQMVRVRIQLKSSSLPVMPAEENFRLASKPNDFYSSDNDLMYLRYYQEDDGSTHTVYAPNLSFCMIVPAGKTIKFISDHKPLSVLNMVDEVKFPVDNSKIPPRNALSKFLLPHISYHENWQYLHDNWDIVDTSGIYLITAKAMSRNDIPEPKLGGLICL